MSTVTAYRVVCNQRQRWENFPNKKEALACYYKWMEELAPADVVVYEVTTGDTATEQSCREILSGSQPYLFDIPQQRRYL